MLGTESAVQFLGNTQSQRIVTVSASFDLSFHTNIASEANFRPIQYSAMVSISFGSVIPAAMIMPVEGFVTLRIEVFDVC